MIRPVHPADLPALYRICRDTAPDGAAFADPDLLGHVYAGPYAVFEPDLCFVADLDARPAGYVLGTRDSAAFADRCEREWFPVLRHRYPARAGDSHEAGLTRLIQAGLTVDPLAAHYPAHLHIDLLPELAGRGVGRALMTRFLARLTEIGVPGVHLGVATDNQGAQAFYRRLGFELLRGDAKTLWFGKVTR